MTHENILVTGGAGFIGSAFVRHMVGQGYRVAVLDMLSYAGCLASLSAIAASPHYRFYRADIRDPMAVNSIFKAVAPTHVVHFAAESHVDRSIEEPGDFITTNIVGTQVMLDATLAAKARFVHISTDEVFGELGTIGTFNEASPYNPRSPYSASKAASDHLVRAWHETYGLETVITNCTNNYGPHQYPEKLIPNTIISALEGRPLPVYGDGANVRDWLYVDDHVEAIEAVLFKGCSGRTYCIGGQSEKTNLAVVEAVVAHLDRLSPRTDGRTHAEAIAFVADRPGHDFRYAMDSARIQHELGWSPHHSFDTGLEKTVRWYLNNRDWWEPLRYGGERIGLHKKSPTP